MTEPADQINRSAGAGRSDGGLDPDGRFDSTDGCDACDACLRRTWLIGRLSSALEVIRPRVVDVLELADEELLAAVAGRRRDAIAAELDRGGDSTPASLRAAAHDAGVGFVCRCSARYPMRLRDLPAAPAVLYVAGSLSRLEERLGRPTVAIVGARRCTPYGADVAGAVAADLGRAGLSVVSGMAFGIDGAAHRGVMGAAGGTIAVAPAAPERPTPAAARELHREIVRDHAVIGELGPGVASRPWTFVARNRIIAALADFVLVVEAGERSGSLLTARYARELGRPVGAVPGPVTSPRSKATNAMLARGDAFVRDARDVLDVMFGAGSEYAAPIETRPPPSAGARAILDDVAGAADTVAALVRRGHRLDEALTALASLEVDGWIRRGPGGRYVALA